jgi:hypothetical protein
LTALSDGGNNAETGFSQAAACVRQHRANFLSDQMLDILTFSFLLLGSLRLIGLVNELAERAPAVRMG